MAWCNHLSRLLASRGPGLGGDGSPCRRLSLRGAAPRTRNLAKDLFVPPPGFATLSTRFRILDIPASTLIPPDLKSQLPSSCGRARPLEFDRLLRQRRRRRQENGTTEQILEAAASSSLLSGRRHVNLQRECGSASWRGGNRLSPLLALTRSARIP